MQLSTSDPSVMPIAAKEILHWLRYEMGCLGRIAVVTDHIAMVTAQRRPISGNGGFSLAYHLNNFFIAYGRDGSLHGDVFHVEGKSNPTDSLSRSNFLGQRRSVLWSTTSTSHHWLRSSIPTGITRRACASGGVYRWGTLTCVTGACVSHFCQRYPLAYFCMTD